MLKKSVVGVSVTPEAGLEIAEIDYASRTVIKYGRKSVDYNIVKREIADIDVFNQSLQDLLEDMEIPAGTELVLSLPTVMLNVTDYPGAMDDLQVGSAIEEEAYENPFLKDTEPCCSYTYVNKSLQFNKVAYTAVQKPTLIELILFIRGLGYKIKTIDTSVNSMFHSLVYLDRVNIDNGVNWVLLTIENNCCRVLSMSGKSYMEAYEEKISIGEVLSDAENYATVITAIEPILKNLPSQYLCVVSKTNVISAEVIANKITYSAPIIYQEANAYRKDVLLNLASDIDPDDANLMSLDIIGAAIYPNYALTTKVNFNFFNRSLGDIYLNEQPPSLFNGKLVLTNDKLILFFILFSGIMALFLAIFLLWYTADKITKEKNIANMEAEIAEISQFLERHKNISSGTFDEGLEVKNGLAHNKNIYSYYTIVGTEIPAKLWLTHLKMGDKITIEGQADNIESVYGFFRNIRDYNPSSDIVLQKLGLASNDVQKLKDFDKESLLTTLNADFYEFNISNDPDSSAPKLSNNGDKGGKKGSKKNSKKSNDDLPGELEPIN